MANFLTKEVETAIIKAIEIAEKQTSGEIVVYLKKRCGENIYEEAKKYFKQKKLFATQERNAVLIFLAYGDHKLAILGDEGINQKVPENFWQSTLDLMLSHFRENNYSEGLEKGILAIGEKLKEFFPWKEEDKNELSNEIKK